MELLQHLLPSLLTGLTVSFLFEQLLTPKPLPPWRRTMPTLMLHCGSWLALFAIGLLLCQRPWFAVILLWAFQLLLLLVNHAKYDSLRETFIFQDFEYFTDALKHPRLYLPFFGVGRTIAATLGFITAIIVGILLETPLTDVLTLPVFISVWATILVAGLFLIRVGIKRRPAVSYNPSEDLRDLGQIAFFWAYWQDEKLNAINLADTPFKNPDADVNTDRLADIIVVQSESFFDSRVLSDTIRSSVLENFDQTKTETSYHGRLEVPAWGANTVRTECAFLTGLTPDQLGIHRFNPYRILAKQGIPNLVSYLKQLGYQTLCIHPYPASFYLRDQVFPRMGFDQFIDIKDFNEQQKCGQYIGDLAVAGKVAELLGNATCKPLFIFVITMENHGPLHLEHPEPADNANFYHQTPEAGCDNLTVYLRHLKNADLMIKKLKESLLAQAKARAGMLCWYGDHVPIMTGVYERFGEPDGLTDYFIWTTFTLTANPKTEKEALISHVNKTYSIHDLTKLILNLIGIKIDKK
ncbi:MAG: LTA synthase family protein [Methylovulum sp.]